MGLGNVIRKSVKKENTIDTANIGSGTFTPYDPSKNTSLNAEEVASPYYQSGISGESVSRMVTPSEKQANKDYQNLLYQQVRQHNQEQVKASASQLNSIKAKTEALEKTLSGLSDPTEIAQVQQEINLKKDEAVQLSEQATKSPAFSDAKERIKELDTEYSFYTNSKGKKVLYPEIRKERLQEQYANLPNIPGTFLGAHDLGVKILTAFSDITESISQTLTPTEKRSMKPEDKVEYLKLKSQIRNIEVPLVAADYAKRNQQYEYLANQFAILEQQKELTGVERLNIRSSLYQLEKAIKEQKSYLDNDGGSDIVGRELSRISLTKSKEGIYIPFSNTVENITNFFFKDNLIEKEQKVGYKNLTEAEKLSIQAYASAQETNQTVEGKQNYTVGLVKGTVQSLDFMKDMAIGSALTNGGKLFSATRLYNTGQYLTTAQKMLNTTLKVGDLAAMATAQTYFDPGALNQEIDPQGIQLIKNKSGKVIDALAREDLYEYKAKSLEEEKIKLQATKRDLLSQQQTLTKEQQDVLKYIDSRLGINPIEDIPSIDDELSSYHANSGAKAHLKAIGSNMIETGSELYTKNLIKGMGKGAGWVAKKIPGAERVILKVSGVTENVAEGVGKRFYNTGVGKAYKTWNEAVGTFNIAGQKVTGSVFEEIKEEWAGAIGHSLLDWDTKNLQQTFSTQGTLDIGAQTLLLTGVMGASQTAHMHAKLLYNSAYKNKIEAYQNKLETLEKFLKENPEDKDTANSIEKLTQEKTNLEEKSSLTGLGITRRLTGDKTGFSSTRQYVDNRNQVRDVVQKLREASSDEDINKAIDISTLSILSPAQKAAVAETLNAKGKKEAADLVEKSMFRDMIYKAFQTNTEDELEGGIEKALKNKELSAEAKEKLGKVKEVVSSLREVREEYSDNPAVQQAVHLTYEELSAKEGIEEAKKKMVDLYAPVKERIDAIIKAKGFNITYNLEDLFTKKFEDPKEQAEYDKFTDALLENRDKVIDGYHIAQMGIEDLQNHRAKAIIAKNEILYPSPEIKNGNKFLREVHDIAKDLAENSINPLNLKNVKYNEEGQLIPSKELMLEIFDSKKEEWVGDPNKGKISMATFTKLKNEALDNQNRIERMKELQERYATSLELSKEEEKKAEAEEPELDELSEVDTEALIVVDADVVEQKTTSIDENLAALFGGFSADFSMELPEGDVPDLPTSNITDTGNAIIVNNDIDAFLDELTVAPLNMSKEQEEAVKSFVETEAQSISSITGQSVSLSQLIDNIFFLATDKKTFLERLPLIFAGWNLNNYQLEEGEILKITTKYRPMLEGGSVEEINTRLANIAETMPNIYTSTVKNSVSQTSVEYKEEQEAENKKEGAVDNTEEVKSTFSEEEAMYILANQENSGEPQPEIFAEPRIGYNTMPYEVVVENGVSKKVTKGSLMKDFESGPMGVDPRSLLDPNNGPTIPLKIGQIPESEWGIVLVSEGKNASGETITVTFSDWLAKRELKDPNFRNTQEFLNKVPMVYTNLEGKRTGYVHDTDWYDSSNVPNPNPADETPYESNTLWQKHVEASKNAEQKLREAVKAGLTEVTAVKPERGVYHSLSEDENLMTVKESNPQAFVAVQRGVTKEDLDGLPKKIKEDFLRGRKRLINRTTGDGSFNQNTNGHTWTIHRVGTEINPATGQKVETYQAIKVNPFVSPAAYTSIQWAIAAHKVSKGERVPAAFGMSKEDANERFIKPIERAMGLRINTSEDLGKYIQHFVKLTPKGLLAVNSEKRTDQSKAIGKGKQVQPWKDIKDFNASIGFQILFFEGITPEVGQGKKVPTLTEMSVRGSEMIIQNTSIEGLDNKRGLVMLNNQGVVNTLNTEGKPSTYEDFVKENSYLAMKAFDVDTTGKKPIYALMVQPVITIQYDSPLVKTGVEKIEEVQTKLQQTAEALETKVEENKSEPFNYEEVEKLMNSLGVNLEDFEEKDNLIGDISQISNLFDSVNGFSTMEELPVREHIAHSLISMLDFKSKVNKSTKKEIKEKIKKAFEDKLQSNLASVLSLKTKVENISSEESGVKQALAALTHTATNIQSLLDSFEKVYEKALVEVNKEIKVDLSEEVDKEDEILSVKDYSKESIEEQVKSKASSRLRMLMSLIPQFDKAGKPVLGYLGFPRYSSLNDTYNEVLKTIAINGDPESNFKSLIEKLRKTESPSLKEVIDRLEKADEQVQNEFVYNVVAHTLTSKFAMYETNTKGFSLSLYDTNANEITKLLKNIWKENSVASDLYNYDGTINEEYAKKLLATYNEFPKELNSADPDKLRKWLSDLGLEMNDKTWNQIYAIDKGVLNGGKFYSFENLYSGGKNGLFKPLADFLTEAIKDTTGEYNVGGETNILSNLSGMSSAIIKIEAKYNPQLVALSYRDSGKNISTQTPPKFVTDKVTELNRWAIENTEKLDALRKLSFTQDSLILETLAEAGEEGVDNFLKVHHTSITAVKERNVQSFGSNDITSLGEIDYDFATTVGFSSRRNEKVPGNGFTAGGFKKRMANMLFPTMSDKSTGLYLTTPIIDFLSSNLTFNKEESGEIKGLSADTIDLLFNYLIIPELKRIHKFHSEVKVTNIKGYDKAAGLFHLLPIMNSLVVKGTVKDKLLIDVLKEQSETASLDTIVKVYGDLMKSSISSVVEREVQAKLSEWAHLKEEGKGSKMFSPEYFTTKGIEKDPHLDYEAGVYDYVMNSMIFNAEIFKVFAGDISLYSQDKLYKKEPKTAEEFTALNKSIGVNLGKRLALLIAPGKKIAESSDEKYNQIFLKDTKDVSENIGYLIELYEGADKLELAKPLLDKFKRVDYALDYLKSMAPTNENAARLVSLIEKYERLKDKYRQELKNMHPTIGDYFDIEATDAQEYTTITEHVNILQRLGRITKEESKSILNTLAKGEELKKEDPLFAKVMQPIKPVHTGSYINSDLDVNQMIYIKSSSFPLLPQLTAGTRLDDLRKSMEKLEGITGRFTRASFQSANKVGSVEDANTIDPLNSTDLLKMFNDIDQQTPTSSVMVLDRNNFRIQQDVPFKSDKKSVDTVAMGTQIFKDIFGDGMIDIQDFNLDGKTLTGKELHAEFNRAFESILNSKKEQLFEDLGLDAQGNITDEVSFNKNLQKLLVREAVDRGYSIKSVRGLTIQELSLPALGLTYFDFKTPLWLSPDSNRYESLLNSIITNRLMKHKMPGNGYIVGSENGMKFKEGTKDLDKSRVIFLDGWNGKELQGVHTVEKEGEVKFQKAQVFAPSKFKGKDGKLIDLFEGFNEKSKKGKYIERVKGKLKLIDGKIDPQLFNLFSFRTPTSSHVSGSSIEIVGILPPESGDLMIVPKHFTKQKGLDFDVDKESGYQLNHYVDAQGNIKEYTKESLLEETKKQRESLEKMHAELLETKRKGLPLSSITEDLKNLLEGKLPEEEIERFLSPEVGLSAKLRSLDRLAKRKIDENTFIKAHLAVYNNPNPEVQNKINKVLSMDFASGQASQFEKWTEAGKKEAFISKYSATHPDAAPTEVSQAYLEDAKNFSMLSYSYQRDKMALGSVGKTAIGVYANYTTYAALIQQHFGEEGMEIVDPKTKEPKVMTIGKFTSTHLGARGSLSPSDNAETWAEYHRSMADIFGERVNTATDNEKEQILGRVGVNDNSINVDSLLSLRGFDRDENGNSIPYLLLSQPAVRNYLKTIKDSKGIFGEFLAKEAVINTMLQELSGGTITYEKPEGKNNYEFISNGDTSNPIVWQGSSSLTGEALVEGIKSDGKNDKDVQLDALMTFIECQKEATIVAEAQKVTNTNNLGKSMVESISKHDSLAALVNNSMLPNAMKLIGETRETPFEGAYPFSYEVKDPLTGEIEHKVSYIKSTTPQGHIVVNGLFFGNNLFKSYFPYRDSAFKQVFKEIGLPENATSRVEEIETILEEVKKYLYSNPKLGIFNGDVNFKRKNLFIDENKQLEEFDRLISLEKENYNKQGYSTPYEKRGYSSISLETFETKD